MALTSAQQISQLYVGYFDRAPDPEGLNYWIGRLNSGEMTINQIAQSFSEQPEALETYPYLRYPNLLEGDTEQFITEIYQNMFNRDPDAEGLAYWTEQLTSGAVPVGDFIASVAGGATNSAAGQDLTTLTNKTDVGLTYADAVAQANVDWTVESAHLAVTDVNDTDASVVAADVGIATFIQTGYWPGTEPAPGVHEGTAGIVDLISGEGLVAEADGNSPANTYVSGTVNGTGDNVADFKLNGDVTAQVTLNDIPVINLETGVSPTSVSAKGWNGTQELNINQPSGDVLVSDIQSGATQVDINDANQGPAQSVDLTYDAQGVIANAGAVNIGVRETFANVSAGIQGQVATAIETINLTINDTEGHDSTLADLQGDGTTTLNIDGGYEGGKFTITEALDGTLTAINAGEVASDLSLNVSEAGREALTVQLGKGNDVLATGNTLNNDDVISGGEGDNRLSAVFTSAGTRTATISQVQTLDLTFNANARVDFRNVDDVETINVASSTNRIDLTRLDNTFTTLNVSGPQAVAANGNHSVNYAGDADGDLTVNWTNQSSATNTAANNTGSLSIGNAAAVAFNYDGDLDTNFAGPVGLTVDGTTETLTITNNGTGAVDFGTSIMGTESVTDLSFVTTDSGTITTVVMPVVNELENLNIQADQAGVINIDAIGAGAEVDHVNISATGRGAANIGLLDAPQSTISELNITVGNNSDVTLTNLFAGDVAEANITIGSGGAFHITNGVWDLDNNSGSLTVSGAGVVIGNFTFSDQAIASQDFSGLTGSGVNVSFVNDNGGVELLGTSNADIITGGLGSDDIDTGAGNDIVSSGAGGDNVIDLGAGNDTVFIQDGGDNSVTLGAGNDTINLLGIGDNVITDFNGLGSDTLNFSVTDLETAGGFDLRTGTDGAINAGSPVVFQSVTGQSNLTGASIFQLDGTFSDAASVQTAIQTGGSLQLRTAALGNDLEVNDSIMVSWQDNSGNTYLSAAEVVSSQGSFLTGYSYNFDLTDLVQLAGVSDVNQTDFAFV
ncbi:MAG: DUF4214 domain-containing protein [Xanthobacter sp.]